MTWDPVHDARRIFRVLVDAQCAPGTRVDLPGVDTPIDSWTAVPTTLLDEATPAALVPFDPVTEQHLVELGVPVTEPADADFVLARSDGTEAVRSARIGTALNPETGATVLLTAGTGSTWALTGPGLPDTHTRLLPIAPATMAARNRACADYPTGIDLLIVGAGAVWAVPRSTRAAEVG